MEGLAAPWLPHRGFGPWPLLADLGKILTTVIHRSRGGNKDMVEVLLTEFEVAKHLA